MSKYDFDLFVIGAGSGGTRLSRMAAGLGARVAVAEDTYLGGTCVNVGCVPKKLFVQASHFGEGFHAAEGFGWSASGTQHHWPTLRDRKDAEIQRLNGIYAQLIEGAGAEIVNGTARFLDPHTVAVGDRRISAERIVVASGSWPYVPDFAGREHVITSNEVFHLESLPRRALVVGGGYIAVEFAGIFKGLGVDTTLSYRGPLFLRGFDDGVRRFVAEELKKKDIALRFGMNPIRVVKRPDGSLVVDFEDGESDVFDLVLYATGRRPKIDGLGLAAAGVQTTAAGAVQVDDRFRTSTDNVFALGDVIDRFQLTPVAIREAMVLAHNLFAGRDDDMDYDDIPTAVFCQPNIGTVGLTEAEAQARHRVVDVYEAEFRPLMHTLSGMPERNYMKLLVDGENDRVIGAHMVGDYAGEILQGLGIAVKSGATKADFDATVGIHPTTAEEFVTMRTRERRHEAA
jgi:glutathione reductase (NADPH)